MSENPYSFSEFLNLSCTGRYFREKSEPVIDGSVKVETGLYNQKIYRRLSSRIKTA